MNNLERNIKPLCFSKTQELSVDLSMAINSEGLEKNIDTTNFGDDLPEISPSQVISIATDRILSPLKKQQANGFGSEWNRLTALMAAQSLGLPEDHLLRLLSRNTKASQKIKKRQAEIEKALQLSLINEIEKRFNTFRLESSKTVWVENQQNLCQQILNGFPDLSKSHKKSITHASIASLIDIIHQFHEQAFDRSDLLRRIVISTTQEKPISLIAVHCPPFRHSDNGINVMPSAKNELVENAKKEKVIVSQIEVLKEIDKIANVFRLHGIATKVVIALVDIDEFVIGNQKEALLSFCRSLKQEINTAGLKMDLSLISQLTETEDLESPKTQDIWHLWQNLVIKTDKTAVRLVDEEFSRLQKTNLPAKMKTREFATHMAGRRFVVHFLIGKSIPQIFPTGIVLLRARGTQASEIDRLGAKSINKRICLLHHWKERTVITNNVESH